MNEFTPISLDSAWMFGAIAVSFFAGCVYRLSVLVGRGVRSADSNGSGSEDLNHRFDREMQHVRQLQNELLQVRRAVEQRPLTDPTNTATPDRPAEPARPAELGIDPFKLAVSGASIKVLMSRCRLSRAEAELVFSIHGAGSGRATSKARRGARAPQQALTA